MSSEWRQFRLGDLATFKYGKFLAKSQLQDKGFPVFSGYGVVGYLPEYQFAEPQLLIVSRGEGGTGDVKLSPPNCSITNLSIIISVDESKVTKRFLYWALKARDTRILRTGSAQAQIVVGSLEKFLVEIPEQPSIQHAIADILDTFDDRITLLRETSATLEAIAQALFKSWFVDFDPVRAKMEGRAPEGMDEATAALFPDSFEESELGLVPKGWRVGCVGDLARQKKGSVNPLASPSTMFEHYSLPAFDAGQAPVVETGDAIKSNKTPLPAEAVLLSKLNPHIPRIWLPVVSGLNAVCSTEFLAYSPCNGSGKEFIYCLFSSPYFLMNLRQLVTGTSNSHQRVKPDQISSTPVVVPATSVLAAFTEISQPIFKRVYENRQQVQTLVTLRDTLLPRLISGQLRLPAANEEIEEAIA